MPATKTKPSASGGGGKPPTTDTAAHQPEEPDDERAAAVTEWLVEMGTKTDSELLEAYIASAASGRPFIHPMHVVRVLKLAALGLPGGDQSE